MLRLPQKYKDAEKSLPFLVRLTSPVEAHYRIPFFKTKAKVKIPAGRVFSIKATPKKIYAEGEEVFVESDIIILKGIITGNKGRIYGSFKYQDLINAAEIVDVSKENYQASTKSILIYGLPRKTFYVGFGAALLIAGIYYYKKK